jgi:hypothetical protein
MNSTRKSSIAICTSNSEEETFPHRLPNKALHRSAGSAVLMRTFNAVARAP